MRLSLVLLFATYLFFTLPNPICAQTATTKIAETDTIATLVIKVKGITCGTDLQMIAEGIEELKGNATCKIVKRGPTTTLKISYNPTLVTRDEIYSTIEGTGSCENPDERPYKVKK